MYIIKLLGSKTFYKLKLKFVVFHYNNVYRRDNAGMSNIKVDINLLAESDRININQVSKIQNKCFGR